MVAVWEQYGEKGGRAAYKGASRCLRGLQDRLGDLGAAAKGRNDTALVVLVLAVVLVGVVVGT